MALLPFRVYPYDLAFAGNRSGTPTPATKLQQVASHEPLSQSIRTLEASESNSKAKEDRKLNHNGLEEYKEKLPINQLVQFQNKGKEASEAEMWNTNLH